MVVDLLIPLARDEYSAHSVYEFMSSLENYTEELVPHSLAKTIDLGPEGGTWVMRRSRPILESEYWSLGLSPLLVLERGTMGVVLEEGTDGGGNEIQLVSWKAKYSGWDLFAALVQRLLYTSGIGVGMCILHCISISCTVFGHGLLSIVNIPLYCTCTFIIVINYDFKTSKTVT